MLGLPAVALLPKLNCPKIVYPIIANECRFAIDRHGYLVNDKLFVLPTDDAALLGLLNSRVANFDFSAVCAALEGSGDKYLIASTHCWRAAQVGSPETALVELEPQWTTLLERR